MNYISFNIHTQYNSLIQHFVIFIFIICENYPNEKQNIDLLNLLNTKHLRCSSSTLFASVIIIISPFNCKRFSSCKFIIPLSMYNKASEVDPCGTPCPIHACRNFQLSAIKPSKAIYFTYRTVIQQSCVRNALKLHTTYIFSVFII